MARKIRNQSAEASREELYPWLRLLELEVQRTEHPTPRRGRGRPPNPFPRRAIHVTLTDSELAMLDELVERLSRQLNTRLHRGHVVAFMLFYMKGRLQESEDISDIRTLSALARYLDRESALVGPDKA